MRTDDHIVDPGHILPQISDQIAVHLEYSIAHGVRNIQRRGACLDYRFENLTQEHTIRTCRVLPTELHISHIPLGVLHCRHSFLQNLRRRHTQHVFHVDGTRTGERVNTPPLGIF